MAATPASAAGESIKITEVAPWSSANSTVAADWFELTNTGSVAVNITGWKIDDNSNSATAAVALNGITSIAPGESVIFLETAALTTTQTAFISLWFGGSAPAGLQIGSYNGSGVGLGTGGDAVNIFDASGVLVTGVSFGASTTWFSFDNAAGLGATSLPLPAVTQLSAVGTNGAFASVGAASGASAGTKEVGSPGTATVATPTTTTTTAATTTTTAAPSATYNTWPGDPSVQAVDLAGTFTSNLSGLDYEPSGSTAAGVLWAVVNGPGTLHRLVFDGTNWVPDTTNGWSAGKPLRYPDGTGDPDSEGVTYVGSSSAVDGLYVATERNNAASSTSRLSILRFNPSDSGTTLTATNEWNLTADLPATGANLGLEAITWIPDSYLTKAPGFYDQAKSKTYDPADYPGHGTGLFFVGVEGTGNVHAYALRSDNTFTRVASFSAGFTSATVMELQFDQDLEELWAVCDNGCTGRTHVLKVDSAGAFTVLGRWERPLGPTNPMPDTNNEGFAIAPEALCVGGTKPVFWSDDNDLNGFSLRQGRVNCTSNASVATPTPIPEFPVGLVGTGLLIVLLAGATTVLRRRSIRPV
ncbi:MAG: lamin tail domain-containing protein [Acidimicrobiales bacterium]